MLDLYTVVWGKSGGHRGLLDIYLGVTLPSLMQPDNIPAAADPIRSYNIYTDDRSKDQISQNAAFTRLAKSISVSFKPIAGGIGNVNQSLLLQMQETIAQNDHMLGISPDWAVGNGSILNLAQLCTQQYDLILFGFPKISPAAFPEIKAIFDHGEQISNRRLVNIIRRYGDFQIRADSRSGPVFSVLSQLSSYSWLICHRCPTPCVKPDNRVLEFFSQNPTPNQGYDHALPIWMIQNGYSWHLVDKSDVFCIAEEAEAWRGASGPWGLDLLSQADVFFSQFIQTWQGEEDV